MSDILIYEDCETDDLQQLLQFWYKTHKGCDVRYASSTGNLAAIIEEVGKLYSQVAVYVDVSPGNPITYRTYNALSSLATNFNAAIVILPILGAEYYFILSLYSLKLMNDPDIFNILLGDYSHLDYLRQNNVPNHLRYFSMERFLKYILTEKVYPCIAQKLPNNYSKGVYYKYDCKLPTTSQLKLALLDKSKAYLCQFPVIPGAVNENYHNMTVANLTQTHRHLVDQYNRFANCMLDSCPKERRDSILHIDYLY